MADIYKANIRLADLITFNPSLVTILARLEIKLGFGDSNVKYICNKYGLSVNLFLMICNIYSFKDYKPDIDFLEKKDLNRIISYLRKSHFYYINIMFPSLHESIHTMVKDFDEVNKKLINKFYDDYEAEVMKHFRYEEKTVFPYVTNLLLDKSKNRYKISKFSHKHSDIDEKLSDLKNIIIKYLPEQYSTMDKTEVLIKIFNIEEDLRNHSIVEDHILFPLVKKVENE